MQQTFLARNHRPARHEMPRKRRMLRSDQEGRNA